MTDQDILSLLKCDLGFDEENHDKDILLQQIIGSAKEYIVQRGVSTLSMDSFKDVDLVRMYSAWLFRKRASDKGDGVGNIGSMPRMLEMALNDRIFSEKMREEVTA
jgi:hypothetical protein